MALIPVPISSAPGVKAQEGAGRLVNAFAEKAEEGARFPVIWKRCAGLRFVVNSETGSNFHHRGSIYVGTTLVSVFNQRVATLTFSGTTWTSVNRGALTGVDQVTIARNNAATPNIVCVSATNGCFNLFTSSAPTAFADADLPANPTSVSELNGYFLWTFGDGRIFASDLNAVTVNALSFTTEQSLGQLMRGVNFKGEWYAFGQKGTGVYKDIGASPFPLQRQFTLERGIAGTHAIAGWEEGWAKQLIWVGEDGVVYRLNGYTPEAVSNDDVTRKIQECILAGDGNLMEACVYMQGKHAMWQLSYPGVWTWEFNNTTGNWHERESYERPDCRVSGSVFAFNRWIIGDTGTDSLYQIDETYYKEDTGTVGAIGDPLIFEIVTGPVANFPGRLLVPRADFDITSAVGIAAGEDPIQTDPQVMISWSTDGGYSFGNQVSRAIGAQGASRDPVVVQRIGMTTGKGVRFRLRVSDPVHCAFLGGQVPVEQRAA